MGVSYAKHQELRRRPWPRYRVSVWSTRNLAWRDLPAIEYDEAEAARTAYDFSRPKGRARVTRIEKDGRMDVVHQYKDGQRESIGG